MRVGQNFKISFTIINFSPKAKYLNDKLQMMHKRQYQNLTNIYELNGNYKQNLQNIFYLLFSKASRAHEEQKIEKSFFKLFKKLLVKIFPILK